MDAETYFLAIERADGAYQGRLHRGDPAKAIVLPDLALGQAAQVVSNDEAFARAERAIEREH